MVEAFLSRGGGLAELGTVGVVAVRDHPGAASSSAGATGCTPECPKGALPELYDPESGQPWTRERLTYLLHDLHCRALDRRDALSGEPDRALSPTGPLR